MSQFDTMTYDERVAFNRAWIKAAHDNGTYVSKLVSENRMVDFDSISINKYVLC